MNKPPAFQFYANNFLTGTAEFTCEEVGAYIRLLCYQWDRGGLPPEQKKLCELARCTTDALASILHKFACDADGMMRNATLERVRLRRSQFVETRSGNARVGWEGARGEARRNALASKVHKQKRSKNHGVQCVSNNNPVSPLMLRIGGWQAFGRRPGTLWTKKEVDRLQPFVDTPEEDLLALEAYYDAEEHQFDEQRNRDIRRRDIQTLLNNWPGEIDRAKIWHKRIHAARNGASKFKPLEPVKTRAIDPFL